MRSIPENKLSVNGTKKIPIENNVHLLNYQVWT